MTKDYKNILNELARKLYKLKGCIVSEGYDFSSANHPEERLMWLMAEMAYGFAEERIE